MDRRNFLNWMGVGAFASSLPVILAACQGSDTPTRIQQAAVKPPKIDKSMRENGFQALDTLEQLEAKESITDRI
ncbi:MAG: hypothetical protein AAGG02_19895 [Cyanobacteria bacterium P01_H01_bin.15]